MEFDNPSTQLVINMDNNPYVLNFTDLASGFNPTSGIDINGNINSNTDQVTITDLGDSLTGPIDIDLAGGTATASFSRRTAKRLRL